MAAASPRPTIPRLDELPLELETHRLRLRPFREADVDAIWPTVSDPEVPRYMGWAAHSERAETVAFIRRGAEALAANTSCTWAIEREGVVVGCIGLDKLEWQVRVWRVDRAELGFWLARSQWRQGVMTEAAHAVVRFGFETVGLHKISVGCIAENEASRRVIEKVGFRFVGRLDDDVWRDGRWWSSRRYELTAPEWPDVHTTMRVSRPRPP